LLKHHHHLDNLVN